MFDSVTGTFDPVRLLLTGYLYCHYNKDDDEAHLVDLWLLLNPRMLETVDREQVKTLLWGMMYISID